MVPVRNMINYVRRVKQDVCLVEQLSGVKEVMTDHCETIFSFAPLREEDWEKAFFGRRSFVAVLDSDGDKVRSPRGILLALSWLELFRKY